MSSKLQKAEGGFRALQILLVIIFAIFWVYLRLNGFGEKWDGAPDGAVAYGTLLFAIGVIASIMGLVVAGSGIVYVVRTHYANHGLGFHAGRWVLEMVGLWLFVALRVVFNIIPAKYLPELIQTSNAKAEPTYDQIRGIASAGISVIIVLFALTHWLVVAQAFMSRRERKRNHNFGKLNGEAYGSSDYLTDIRPQPFDGPQSKPSFSSSPAFSQPPGAYESPNPGAFNPSQNWSGAGQPQQPSQFHQQQASWGGSTQASLPQQPQHQPTYSGYHPGYATPGVVGQLTPSYVPQHRQQPSQGSFQQGYRPTSYAPQHQQQQHSRDPSFGTVYGNVGGGRPSISPPMVQGQQNRF